jgi:hypothetical protein
MRIKIMIHRLVLVFTFIVILLNSGCRNDHYVEVSIPNCDTTWYQREIRPIIKTNCSTSGCHDGTNVTPDFNVYLNLKEVIDTKINGKPEILYRIDLPLSDVDHMPDNGLILSSIDRTKLEVWINNGYKGCDQ